MPVCTCVVFLLFSFLGLLVYLVFLSKFPFTGPCALVSCFKDQAFYLSSAATPRHSHLAVLWPPTLTSLFPSTDFPSSAHCSSAASLWDLDKLPPNTLCSECKFSWAQIQLCSTSFDVPHSHYTQFRLFTFFMVSSLSCRLFEVYLQCWGSDQSLSTHATHFTLHSLFVSDSLAM